MSALTAGPLYLSGQRLPSAFCSSVARQLSLVRAVLLFITEKQIHDRWGLEIASLPSYQPRDSKGRIGMFSKERRRPTKDTCHNTRLGHGGSVEMASSL